MKVEKEALNSFFLHREIHMNSHLKYNLYKKILLRNLVFRVLLNRNYD